MNDRVAELFHQLADLSPQERTRYLPSISLTTKPGRKQNSYWPLILTTARPCCAILV
jgi:hypothetical protein